MYSYSLASCSVRGASIRPIDEYPPDVTNTLSKTRGKYSSHRRIPSPAHGASIRPMDEYPLQNMGRVFVHGRIPSRKHGASTRARTNTLAETWGKYSSTDESRVRNVRRILVGD
ncbi:unnamed protein product [Laminaria digitata]